MRTDISPSWVMKTGSQLPLIYYFFISNSLEPFSVYLIETPDGKTNIDLSDADRFPNGFFQLVGNELTFVFNWVLDADTPAGFYVYKLSSKSITKVVKLAVIDYTYKKVLDSTKLGVVPDKGFGWIRANNFNRSWATDEFVSTIVTAIERTYWQTGCAPIEFWDWSGINGADLSDQHPRGSHQNGIAVDITYVKDKNGKVDWEWFIQLINNVIALSNKNFRFIINDKWYNGEFWPMLTSNEKHVLFPHVSREAGHGGHKDHTHFNFVTY